MSGVTGIRSRPVSVVTVVAEVLPFALAALLFAAVGLMHVASRVMVVRLGYELSRLEAQRTTLERQRSALMLEVATLRAPGRLEALGKRTAGLAPPPPGSILPLAPLAAERR